MAALPLSLWISAAATALSLAIGTPLAWLLARKRFPGRSVAEGLTTLPLVLPPTVLGYYLLVLYSANGPVGRAFHAASGLDLAFAPAGIVIAACVASIPLYLRQAQVAFASIEPDLEDAARASGASEWQVFRHVTAPLAGRGLLAGTVLAFARSLGDFGATLMVGGNIPGRTHTLPLAVYDAWQSGDNGTAAGLSLVLSAIALAVAVAAARLAAR